MANKGRRRATGRATAKKASGRRAAPAGVRAARRRPLARASAAGPGTGEPGKARWIVYVHGIGNKPVPSVLKCQWDQALFGFPLGERSRLAYWVNRGYYPDPTKANCKSGDAVALELEPTGTRLNVARHVESVSLEEEVRALGVAGARQAKLVHAAHELEQSAEAKRLRELAAAEKAGSRERQMLLDAAAVLEAGSDPRRLERVASSAVRARILPLPPAMRRWLTRKVTRALLRDVADYLYDDARRDEMRASLRDRIPAGEDVVVVGHSLGSVIAYDVLRRLPAGEARVPLFVTVGSPLGLQEVQDLLPKLTGGKLAVPDCVGSWLNVADPLDIVAIDKRIRSEFAANARGVRIEDELEWNEDGLSDPHSGTGYLRTKPVRSAVHDAVDRGLFQPVANFVLARDLSRDLEDQPAHRRHKVLIELAEPAAREGKSLDEVRGEVVAHVARVTGRREFAEGDGVELEELQRFVAARLTREELERLSVAAGVSVPAEQRALKRVWRNATKKALLEVSGHTVQAFPAHGGYRALGEGVRWAILDSGVRPDHPHFGKHATIAAAFDCTRRGVREGVREVLDEYGHGTHVAGIVAGEHEFPAVGSAPPRRLSGIAPLAKLHVYKVLDREGTGEDAWIIKALDHVAATNERAGRLVIQGVNLSLGGPFDQSTYGCGHSPLCAELRRLWQQGVLVVIAAGNEGFAVLQTLDGEVDANLDLSIGDPGNLEEAIVVGSVHKEKPHTYGVSYFSSRGPTADGRQKPDLVAPGEKIVSCNHDFPARSRSPQRLYVEMSGTSMAAPHVSGVLAGFLSVRREFVGQPERVKRILLGSCTDLGRDRPQQGAGLPNLMKMLMNT